MEIKFSGRYLKGSINPEDCEMVCVKKAKYADVHLTLKVFQASGDNESAQSIAPLLQFADINMNDGSWSDKENQFETLGKLGDKIADLWNKEHKKGKYA